MTMYSIFGTLRMTSLFLMSKEELCWFILSYFWSIENINHWFSWKHFTSHGFFLFLKINSFVGLFYFISFLKHWKYQRLRFLKTVQKSKSQATFCLSSPLATSIFLRRPLKICFEDARFNLNFVGFFPALTEYLYQFLWSLTFLFICWKIRHMRHFLFCLRFSQSFWRVMLSFVQAVVIPKIIADLISWLSWVKTKNLGQTETAKLSYNCWCKKKRFFLQLEER